MTERYAQPELLETPDNVVALDSLRRVRRINGIPMPLGTMSYHELMSLYERCQDRMVDAAQDTDIVSLYLDQRFPEGPEAA